MPRHSHHGMADRVFHRKATHDVAPKAAGVVSDIEALEEKYRMPVRVEDSDWTGANGTIGGNRARIDANEMKRRFPVKIGHPSPHDKMFDIKRQYVEGSLRDPEGRVIPKDGMGMAIFDESDKQYLAEKELQAAEAEYKSFAASVFNMQDPATAALVSAQILPDFFAEREAEIEKQAQLQADLAKIRMRGYPKNNKELALQFAIKKGKIKLPTGPVWQPETWSDAAVGAVQRGLFNPLRYTLGAKQYTGIDSAFLLDGRDTPGPFGVTRAGRGPYAI